MDQDDIGAQVISLLAAKASSDASLHRLLRHVWADEIEIDLNRQELVGGMMPERGLSVMYGDSNTGKTFWTIDLACRIACGMQVYGMPVSDGIVVYVAAEAPESVQRRVWAWKQHHGVEHVPVLVVTDTIDMLTKDLDALVALILDQCQGERVALIVLDTLAASMAGDENTAQDMGGYVMACQDLRQAVGGHVLILHHCGKDKTKGARGSSALRAAADVEFECEAGIVRVTKMRDGMMKGEALGYRLEDVELGTRDDGTVVRTAVALPLDEPPPKPPRAITLSSRQQLVLDALNAAIVDRPVELPRSRDIPMGTKGVGYETWLEAALRYLPDMKGNKQREAFKRIVEALQDKGLVKHVDGWCWV